MQGGGAASRGQQSHASGPEASPHGCAFLYASLPCGRHSSPLLLSPCLPPLSLSLPASCFLLSSASVCLYLDSLYPSSFGRFSLPGPPNPGPPPPGPHPRLPFHGPHPPTRRSAASCWPQVPPSRRAPPCPQGHAPPCPRDGPRSPQPCPQLALTLMPRRPFPCSGLSLL